MVYKIVGNFEESNFEGILSKLGKEFNLLFRFNTLYASLKVYTRKVEADAVLKKSLKPSRSFVIIPITEKNIMQEEDFIREWCRDNLVSLDRQRYDDEQQEKLNAVNLVIDKMDEILSKKELIAQEANND